MTGLFRFHFTQPPHPDDTVLARTVILRIRDAEVNRQSVAPDSPHADLGEYDVAVREEVVFHHLDGNAAGWSDPDEVRFTAITQEPEIKAQGPPRKPRGGRPEFIPSPAAAPALEPSPAT